MLGRREAFSHFPISLWQKKIRIGRYLPDSGGPSRFLRFSGASSSGACHSHSIVAGGLLVMS